MLRESEGRVTGRLRLRRMISNHEALPPHERLTQAIEGRTVPDLVKLLQVVALLESGRRMEPHLRAVGWVPATEKVM